MRLLEQLRERIRCLHYSIGTGQAYVYRACYFIRWHGPRHPREMGGPEVEAYVSRLANERKVSVPAHHQAIGAILFLYKEVLGIELPWMQGIGRPRAPRGRAVLAQSATFMEDDAV